MSQRISVLSVRRNPVLSSSVMLVLFISKFFHIRLIYAAEIQTLHVGAPIRDTIIGAPHLVNVDGYSTSQALFEVSLSGELLERLLSQNNALAVTTCSRYTSFDTVLYVFRFNPLINNASKHDWINKNDNDCGLQSTVQVSVSSGSPLYLLLTGYRGSTGNYEIRVEEIADKEVSIPWGLDRIDQRLLPLDGRFSVREAGRGVFIYILDSGVRPSHSDFLQKDGSSRVVFGNDFVERLDAAVDESGHGTHVAALAAGRSFGVAKKATIVSVRVLDRTNSGVVSQLVEALEWTNSDIHSENNFPAVIVLSLSSSFSEILNNAVAKVTSAGIAVVTAAGNEGKDSCLVSPSSERSALTVGAADGKDRRSFTSNWGKCVSVYAPGDGVLSAWHTGDAATKMLSGTSSACPLVAGATAALLEQNPRLKPEEIKEVIRSTGTLSIDQDENAIDERSKQEISGGKTTRGRMLYVRTIPVVLRDGQPPDGKMFLYAIFGIASGTIGHLPCHLGEEHVRRIRDVLSSILGRSVEASVDLRMCCQGHLLKGCDDGNIFHGNRLIVRVLTKDSHAYSAFESLSAFCHKQKGAVSQLRIVLGTEVSVVAEPWVLDSRGYKYWAAPALAHTMKRGLSTSKVVLAVCLTAFLALCIVLATLCVIQHLKKKRRLKDQYYFEKKAMEYEVEKHKHSNLGSHETIRPTPIFARGMSRANSELQGDILKCLSPSGVLPTPTTQVLSIMQPLDPTLTPFDRKRDSRLSLSSNAADVQTRADRSTSSRGPHEMIQTSTSFFARLWTPRADRSTATSSSPPGKTSLKGLQRIISFGPERGAVLQPTLPTPAKGDIAIQTTERGAERDETGPNALQAPICSENAQI